MAGNVLRNPSGSHVCLYNLPGISNWSKKIILVVVIVIEEKYMTPSTTKAWIINLNFGELNFFVSDSKPTQNIKKI